MMETNRRGQLIQDFEKVYKGMQNFKDDILSVLYASRVKKETLFVYEKFLIKVAGTGNIWAFTYNDYNNKTRLIPIDKSWLIRCVAI